MDAHYDIVMKAREAAGQGRRRYFAYSTVLDRDAFVEWRSQHGYDFFELPKGTPGSRVCGVVFDLDEKDWPIIQHKEGAVTGMCVERAVTVKLASGETVEATAFTTNPVRKSLDGPVSQRFVEALVRGARSAGLESAWVDSLTG
jgi:cation transport regulator ChaC